ncbi:DUF6602 domain-containing protein [Stenotrophomonas sp. 24(2023)]|uniref:DUF6602 domain-containing protein n=1 Tax=Stenotrophomonas sp. 24(2023) TaxID=3068324 RepID=UPI0027DEFD42|nr:DUF6602 domain-containing protein [Stenotrophomonas sp. 24(2023)]WMJ70634.1 hypothetical protein Q9R17_05910 [Stenotrophomonas sp. 24(2023)]
MSITTFYDLEARKILADGEKVALFTNHPGALGAFREARLRQYIAEQVSASYEVTTGFVTAHDPHSGSIYKHSSKQIDCLIHEQNLYAPLLKSTDFTIVVPKAVAAVIEIKSDLTLFKKRSKDNTQGRWQDSIGEYEWAGTLVDALNNIRSAIDLLDASGVPRDHYFAGIIGYGSTATGQFTAAMTSGELWTQLGISNIDQMPGSICILNESWFMTSAFPWTDEPENDGANDSDANHSFVIKGMRTAEGSSLQMFTAEIVHTLTVVRQGAEHVVGGLRSGEGYLGPVTNHRIDLPSPRQHNART